MTEKKRQLADWLDDLAVRFIINLPKEELGQVERICFQVEEAQWYYEDFIRPLDPDLPSLNLKTFCLQIFKHCPLLATYSTHLHATAFEEFLAYKTRVPVRGAILLNHDLDSVLLVRGWKKGASWSFPRGKINKDEPDIDCAIREVWEETGFDIREAGLVPKDDEAKYIELSIRDQHVRLYLFRDVPMDIHFEPRTRKEIGKIEWYKLSDLLPQKKGKNRQQDSPQTDLANPANKLYMVVPFLSGMKKWIAQEKKLSKQTETPEQILAHETSAVPVTPAAEQAEVVQVKPSDNESPLAVSEAARLMVNGHRLGDKTVPLKLPELEEATVTHNPAVKELATSQYHAPPSNPKFTKSTSTTAMADKSREERAQSLLALLKGKPSLATAELPQTPAEQVITHPHMPPSPKHQVKPEQRVLAQRAPPSFDAPTLELNTNQQQQDTHTTLDPQQRQKELLNAIYSKAPSSTNNLGRFGQPATVQAPTTLSSRSLAQAPRQQVTRLGSEHPLQSPGFASIIPSASDLPPPKLTAHSTKLLDLFKSNKPMQAALEAAPVGAEAPRLGVISSLPKDLSNAGDQASLEVSEIEDHHFDKARYSHREPSEVSFEMPADVEPAASLPDRTPPRPPLMRKQSPRETLAAWQKFHNTEAIQEAEQRRQAVLKNAARAEEEARSGIIQQPEQPIFQETWKKVDLNQDGLQRKVVGVFKDHERSSESASQAMKPTSVNQNKPNGTASVQGKPVALAPKVGLAPPYQSRIALIVCNLKTEEEVRSIFPDLDRSKIKFVEQSRKLNFLVHFNTNQDALDALDRQPPEHQMQPSDRSRGPRVDMFDTRSSKAYTQARPENKTGKLHIPASQKSANKNKDALQMDLEPRGNNVRNDLPLTPTLTKPTSRSEHQNALLNLLKGPPSATSAQATNPTLEAPPSFELSAIPSPGHSRETSRQAGPPVVQPVEEPRHIMPMSRPTTKRGKATLAPRKSPVSATVDGPLNVPQFDMLAQKDKSSPELTKVMPKREAPRKSPITILARPSRAQTPPQSQGANDVSATVQAKPTTTQSAIPPTLPQKPQLQMPSTNLPPKPPQLVTRPEALPNLPTKPSQPLPQPPQTARRPFPTHIHPQAQDPNSILSPIEPLPSPRHKLTFDRRTQQTKEQKQSLLSLFTKPAPPPTEAPRPPSRVDSTASALISPPAVVATFADGPAAADKLSRINTATAGDQNKEGSPRTSTPKETKRFLLGYLDSVVLGGK